MKRDGVLQVMLETEVNNCDAMRLYTNLGFIREKRLFRYHFVLFLAFYSIAECLNSCQKG